MFLVLSSRSKDNSRSPLTVPVRRVACKGGLCFNPSSRVARLAGAPSLHVNRPLHGLNWYVRPQGVWFLSGFGLKIERDFDFLVWNKILLSLWPGLSCTCPKSPYYMKFLRHVNFAILRKFWILTHFNFTFLSDTHFISLSILFKMSLNLINNVEINRNATDYGPGVETESSSDEEDQNIITE